MLDHILLLNKIKAFEFKPELINRIDMISNLLWLIENFLNIFVDINDIIENNRQYKQTTDDFNKIINVESDGIINYKY